jgi:hypothetical protein
MKINSFKVKNRNPNHKQSNTIKESQVTVSKLLKFVLMILNNLMKIKIKSVEVISPNQMRS